MFYYQVESSHEEGEDLSRGYKKARLQNIQDLKTKLNQVFPGKISLSFPPSADAGSGVSSKGRGKGRGVKSRGRGQGQKDGSGSGSSRGKNNFIDPIKWNIIRGVNFCVK